MMTACFVIIMARSSVEKNSVVVVSFVFSIQNGYLEVRFFFFFDIAYMSLNSVWGMGQDGQLIHM